MKARYIGIDGIMGLTHGNIYDINVSTGNSGINLTWKALIPSKFGFNVVTYIMWHYDSFKNLAKDWETVEE